MKNPKYVDLAELYPEVELKDAMAKQFAMHKYTGLTMNAIQKKMGLSQLKAAVLWDSTDVAFHVKQISSDTLKDFKNRLVAEVGRLVPLAVKVLESHLEQNNLNAIPHVLKIIGIDKEDLDQVQNITVYMPGQNAPVTLEMEKPKDKQPVILLDELQIDKTRK